jgi:sugar lactone lactonase YvrE
MDHATEATEAAKTTEAAGAAVEAAADSAVERTPEQERQRRRRLLLLFAISGMLVLLLFLAIWYIIFRQPINPLPVLPDSRLPAYSTSIYGPDMGMGIAVDADGSRIYVAETEGERRLLVYDLQGRLLAAAHPPEAAGSETVPLWIAIDPQNGEVYVSDRPSGRIFVYDRDGAWLRVFTPSRPIPGWSPIGLAFDAAGSLYVGDIGAGTPRVEMFDRSGALLRTFGSADNLSFPNGLAVDAAGRLYVADSNNGRVLLYAPDGRLLAQIGRGSGEGSLGLPRSVALDASGRVHICDTTAQGVFIFRPPTGAEGGQRFDYIGFVGTPGIGDGQFSFPNGVAADGRGRIYITDSGNDRLQIWSY